MSLLNLSRTTPRANCINEEAVTADTFIDEAVSYALGHSAKAANETLTHSPDSVGESVTSHQPMRRATFTLTEECISQLQEISDQSGVAKSRLIRLWIAHFSHTRNDW